MIYRFTGSLNNQRGMSLVGMMVIAGIGLIVMTGMTTMITDIFSAQKAMQSKDANREIVQAIRGYLSDPTACANSFATLGPITSPNVVQATNVKDKNNQIIYQKNTNYLNNLVKVTAFELKNYDAAKGIVDLDIKLDKVGSKTGGVQMLNKTQLQVTVDAQTKITKCHALGSADSLWQLNSNMTDIYYTGGMVGVGTTGPAGKLHVDGNPQTDVLLRVSTTDDNNGPAKNILNMQYVPGIMISNDWDGDVATSNSTKIAKLVLNTASGGYNSGGSIHVEGAGGYDQGQLVFSTGWNSSYNATERMRISNTGNVGIGTPNPGVMLDVNGGIRTGSSTTVTVCGMGQANGEGTTRYNYTTHIMEYCNGTAWTAMGGGGGLGVGQTWQNVTSSRASGTTYTNNTGKPIALMISATSTSNSFSYGQVSLTIGGVTHTNTSTAAGSYVPETIFGIVPDGVSYRASITGSSWSWSELR